MANAIICLIKLRGLETTSHPEGVVKCAKVYNFMKKFQLVTTEKRRRNEGSDHILVSKEFLQQRNPHDDGTAKIMEGPKMPLFDFPA